MIALGLQDLLIASGFKVAGVAAKLAKALAMIELGALDAAIVDANLGGVSASPAGAALDAKELPYLLLSGYSAKHHAEALYTGAAYQGPERNCSQPLRVAFCWIGPPTNHN